MPVLTEQAGSIRPAFYLATEVTTNVIQTAFRCSGVQVSIFTVPTQPTVFARKRQLYTGVMFANSRSVSSTQTGMHPDLLRVLERHRVAPFRKPITDYNRAAFAHFEQVWKDAGNPALILDSGCGVGLSTLQLAQRHPQSMVLGIDQSADRLARGPGAGGTLPQNALLMRADVTDIWRLLQDRGIALQRHYLLYPNPWPKKTHLMRRWHGHPAFNSLIALGGELECRSNWQIYVEECAFALHHLTGIAVNAQSFAGDDPALTPFEEKYRASGHALWRCSVTLPARLSVAEPA